VRQACLALNVSRATLYRRRKPKANSAPRPSPPRALTSEERTAVLTQLNSPRFADQAPRQVYAKLLDEGTYLCSVRTMYRILEDNQSVRERRNQLSHPEYQKPELLATGPNEVWSWDITKLKGPEKWTYYYLYVIIDIHSRYVRAQSADHSQRPRSVDGFAFGGEFTGVVGSHEVSQPASRFQRQPVFGKPIQDDEVPSGLSGTFWLL